MNTPAHLIFGAALFGNRRRPVITAAALGGGFAPDLSLYVLGAVSLYVLQIPPSRVFGELYFSDAWQSVFAIDNSFFVWLLILFVAIRWRSAALRAFASAGLLHLSFDLLLHHDDGRPHFWPVTDWVFESPLSYWDPAHYGNIIGPIEGLTSAAMVIWMVWAFRGAGIRLTMILLLALEFYSVRQWLVMF